MNLARTLVCLSVLALAVSPVAAESVAVNFDSVHASGNPWSTGVYTQLAATATAGVVAQQNWNNVDPLPEVLNQAGPFSGTVASLLNNSGATTAMSVSWLCATTNGIDALSSHATGDQQMMDGFLAASISSGKVTWTQTSATVTISNIPYSQYDIYTYVGSDLNGREASVETRKQQFHPSLLCRQHTAIHWCVYASDFDEFGVPHQRQLRVVSRGNGKHLHGNPGALRPRHQPGRRHLRDTSRQHHHSRTGHARAVGGRTGRTALLRLAEAEIITM